METEGTLADPRDPHAVKVLFLALLPLGLTIVKAPDTATMTVRGAVMHCFWPRSG